eukprot:gene57910-biopygen33110
MNGFFTKGTGASETWRPPADPPVAWERGLTIDHCITRSRDAATVTDVDVCVPPEYNSDHRMLVVSLTPLRGQDINREWSAISQAVQSASATALGKRTSHHRTWQDEFSDRLAAMAQERRALVQSCASGDCRTNLQRLRSAHQRETRGFVRSWWKRTIQSLAGPNGGPNISTVRKLEQTVAPIAKGSARTELYSADQQSMCRTPAAKQERWREHFEQLFSSEKVIDLSYVYARTPRRPVLRHLDAAPSDDEVFRAIRSLKRKKAAGADGIVAELLQMGGPALHERIATFVRLVWEHGEVPKEWRDAVLITIPKKGDLR